MSAEPSLSKRCEEPRGVSAEPGACINGQGSIFLRQRVWDLCV